MVWQVKLADRNFDVDTEVVLVAEDFNDASARILRGSRPVGDFDVDGYALEIVPFGAVRSFVAKHSVDGFMVFLLSFLSARCGFGFRILHSSRDHDVHRDLAVNWLHGIVAVAVMKNPDDGRMRAHHRSHDAAFGAAIRTCGDDVDQHAVTVHGIADRMRRDEDISYQARLKRSTQRACVRNDKAEAVAVHGEASDDQILVGCGLRQGVAVGVELNQFPSGDQLLK